MVLPVIYLSYVINIYVPFDWRAEGTAMVIHSSNVAFFWRTILPLDALGIGADDRLLWVSFHADEIDEVT